MSIDHLQFEYEQSGVEATGPFHDTHYILTVNGYTVPYLQANLMAGTEDRWMLFLDHRFGHDVTDKELHQLLPLFANAMAVAAGFTHHGEGAEPLNRYQSPGGELSLFIFGERQEASYPLLYEGQPLPYLKARPLPEQEGWWDILVDDRLHFPVAEATLSHTCWLLANAMAIAAGYSYFGKGSTKNAESANLYRGQLLGISTVTVAQDESE
jgi:hypothetical protein